MEIPSTTQATEAPVVRLDGLTRHFGERTVLRGITLDLAAGQTLAVLGRNGAGKSTLLRILATLLRPHEGAVKLFGEPLPRQGWKVRGRVGLLGHEPLLYRDLTGRENLVYHARLHRVAPGRVDEVLDAVGMRERAEDPVRSLSRGMIQRLTIARAVLHAPELLLLDEPRSNLDPAAGELVEPLIGRAVRRHTGADQPRPAGGAGRGRPRARAGRRAGRLRRPARRPRSGHAQRACTRETTVAGAILRKDLLLELRTLETLPSMALLSVVTFVIFHFALNQNTLSGQLAAGVLHGHAAVRRDARRQPVVRRRARAGWLRRLPAGAGRPHRDARREGDGAADLHGGSGGDRGAGVRAAAGAAAGRALASGADR